MVEAILSFDGKHVDELKAAVVLEPIATDWNAVCDYFSHADVRLQMASTWVVKAALENGLAVPSDVVDALIVASSQLTSWEAILHVLQSVRFMSLSKAQKKELLAFAAINEMHNKTLVQVWALDAFVRLSIADPEMIKQVEQKLANAHHHKAASVRARARNLQKEFKIAL